MKSKKHVKFVNREEIGFQSYDKRIARDMLYDEVMNAVNHHGTLSAHDKLHILGIVKAKVREDDKNGR